MVGTAVVRILVWELHSPVVSTPVVGTRIFYKFVKRRKDRVFT